MGLAENYAKFILGMFGFFSAGMYISQNDMFGPNSPGGTPLIYWTKGSAHPISEWWARMAGALFFSFLLGPFVFGVPLKAHLKQTMMMTVLHLINFVWINYQSPEECVSLTWYPQIALQVVLVLFNAYILTTDIKEKAN